MTNVPALAGLRVLDLTRLLPGPFCTNLLADLGADVIKVEEPTIGDYMRNMPPLAREQSAYFLAFNRNKRSIALDLRNEAGCAALRKLLPGCDVFVEGFRPGVLDRLGLGHETLHAEQPRLIYASITGYGQTSPLRGSAGHDINYCALSGGAALSGTRDGRLTLPGFVPADLSGALYLAISILTAVVQRDRTGEGCFIDVSMTECVRALHVLQYLDFFQSGTAPQRPADHIFSGRFVCYNLYRTKDGRYMGLGALEPKFWAAFCRAVGKGHLEQEGFAIADDAGRVDRVSRRRRLLLRAGAVAGRSGRASGGAGARGDSRGRASDRRPPAAVGAAAALYAGGGSRLSSGARVGRAHARGAARSGLQRRRDRRPATARRVRRGLTGGSGCSA
jgi:crotonobetainyl-CoA:carnitine CoA-transferase CaiB-like acyl-CoA transferase